MRRDPLTNMSARGGIITTDFLENIRKEDNKNPLVQFNTFNIPHRNQYSSKGNFEDNLYEIWEDLNEKWDALSTKYKRMSVSEARIKWIIPLMRALGLNPIFNKQKIIIDHDSELTFSLSHYGWDETRSPIIHTISPSQDLENKEVTDRNVGNRSPHDELQVFLNVTKGCKWGIITNGIILRILREFHHTTTKGYVEFDIENIFRECNFSDFRTLYRMCHSSRFVTDDDGQCILEKFYQESIATGVSIGENLRKSVKTAIEALGNGFLTEDLIDTMVSDELLCKQYYSEILVIIYRILFLLFAEQRAMLPTRNSLYADEYSIIRLREIAEDYQIDSIDQYYDLWEGLKITFQIIGQGSDFLKVFGYNGSLFDNNKIPLIKSLSCKNSDLLSAIRYLCLIEEDYVQKRINYLDLGVEEIGSIYENLLQFTPRILMKDLLMDDKTISARTFFLDPRGIGRKTTGSYYTDPRLIDALVNSALKPVLENRLTGKSDKEKELLNLKICDPACGSGAFLIAATNFLGKELAQIRTGQAEPLDIEIRKARRDILQHCIYGVDLNPMAVELTKVSLWINAVVENVPLNFLDHHIKCGNSLIGATPELINKGIPNTAFDPVGDDDKQLARKIKRLNESLRGNTRFEEYMTTKVISNVSVDYGKISEFQENEIRDIEMKKKKYNELVESSQYRNQKLAADAWAAAFFWKLAEELPFPPISNSVEAIMRGNKEAVDSDTINMVEKMAKEYHFFHWYLEFPDVFNQKGAGFDCILGNPPWERIKVRKKEFFLLIRPEIVSARASKRKLLIKQLSNTDPLLYNLYIKETRDSDLKDKYFRESGRFPLTRSGDINTFALFAEHSLYTLGIRGLVGIIVPTNMATLETYKEIFANLIDNNKLISLYDFENRGNLFPVHKNIKFSLITMGDLINSPPRFSFFLKDPDEMRDENKKIHLAKDDLLLINPNTLTCPVFKTRREAEIIIHIYRTISPFIIEKNDHNPWEIYYMRFVDLDDHKNEVFSARELEDKGFYKNSVYYQKGEENFLPLYESKLIHQFDHRYATFEGCSIEKINTGYPRHTKLGEHEDPTFESTTRYWISEKFYQSLLSKYQYNRKWLFVYRDVTGSANQRTVISTITPLLPATRNTLPSLGFSDWKKIPFLLANMNTIIFDFVARTKVTDQHLNYGVLKQLPVLSPQIYDSLPPDLRSRIIECVMRLVYTTHSLKSFASDFGFDNPPFKWIESERLDLMCELNGIYAHLYQINEQDLLVILNSFEALKKSELTMYGTYNTKNQTLKWYDYYTHKIKQIIIKPQEGLSES